MPATHHLPCPMQPADCVALQVLMHLRQYWEARVSGRSGKHKPSTEWGSVADAARASCAAQALKANFEEELFSYLTEPLDTLQIIIFSLVVSAHSPGEEYIDDHNLKWIQARPIWRARPPPPWGFMMCSPSSAAHHPARGSGAAPPPH